MPPVKHTQHLSLMQRIYLMLCAFGLALLLLMGVNYCQSIYVLSPLERQSDNIYAISQFLTCLEDSLQSLDAFRWDYGDTEALVAGLERQHTEAAGYLESIQKDLSVVGEEQHLLARAVSTTYLTFCKSIETVSGLLQSDARGEASAEYYERTKPCADYLVQYTRQLLELAIGDNQQAFARTIELKALLQRLQLLVVAITMPLGILLVYYIRQVLGPVQQLAQASQQIACGNLEVPDVTVPRQDEIGRLADAFNEMKRSMKNRVELLNEKNRMERDLHRRETEALEMQSLIEREKMQQLRSQINPHFLFNTLNVIRYTAGQESAPRTEALLTSLSGLLRYSLASNDELVPISNEVRIIDSLFLLYHVRFGDRIRMEWQFPPTLDLTETLIPSFLMQPLVENAFRHGLSPKEEGGCVTIAMRLESERLCIRVEDDGVGMDEAQLAALKSHLQTPPSKGEHVGLYNVATRLRLLGGVSGMEIDSRPGEGTCITLYVPYATLEEEEDMDAKGDEDAENFDCG